MPDFPELGVGTARGGPADGHDFPDRSRFEAFQQYTGADHAGGSEQEDFHRAGCEGRTGPPGSWSDDMRGLDGAPPREPANIGHEFRELRLIKLVTAIVQHPSHRVRERAPKALQMLERNLWVVPAVVEIDRRYVTEPSPKVRRQRNLEEVRSPKWRGCQEQTRQRRAVHSLRQILQQH